MPALGKFGAIGCDKKRQMGELWRLTTCCLEDQYMLERVGEVVLSADDVVDTQIGIIRTRSQMIGGHAIAAQKGKILDIGRRLHLLAVNRICEADLLISVAWDAKPQCKRLSRLGAAFAFRWI